MSKAAGLGIPIRCASSGAAAGVWNGWLTVAMITTPICSGETPARSIACREAASAMSMTLSSSRAKRRVTMPERCWIHSSEESMNWQISSLVTTRSGR
jgi:hypothetical protein